MKISGLQRERLNILATIYLLYLSAGVGSPAMGRSLDYCYTDLGCFPLSEEFYHPKHRPVNVRPWHRSRIRVQFLLFNRRHPDGFQLQPWNALNLRASGFNPRLETKIIIPGWLDNLRRALWSRRMRDAFLWLWSPANVIVVHWRNFTPYTLATANTRLVGAELANLIRWLERALQYPRAFYHLIGHSLGAHISGYCGDRVPGLGRITALDPARPFFQHMPKSVRLDRGDARFVDAIHSDFTPENALFLLMSFGMTTPVGHLDFYPNGPPLLQPGCLRDAILALRDGLRRGLRHKSMSVAFLESVRYLTACDHQRSHEWFIESITNRQCVFVGLRCDHFEGLINGRCTCDDSASACAVMGVHADQLYLNNLHEEPWPAEGLGRLRASLQARKPGAPPTSASRLPAQLPGPREAAHAAMREEARLLRRPPMIDTEFLGASQLAHLLHDEPSSANDADDADDDDDEVPGEPLRPASSTIGRLLSLDAHSPHPEGHSFPERLDPERAPGQPSLLSQVDADIERWYEHTSRWYLKTNTRASYCVNQYQVLVFMGPLRSSSGQQRLRANLLISIIGSRGQLMNQRLVPRASVLDSYTMQPFFILLQGSYSLGNIESVAIGWEARYEPDPVQATVSFKSGLLESVAAGLPEIKLKHPWLSETLAYDYTSGLSNNPAAERRLGDEARGTLISAGAASAHQIGSSALEEQQQHRRQRRPLSRPCEEKWARQLEEADDDRCQSSEERAETSQVAAIQRNELQDSLQRLTGGGDDDDDDDDDQIPFKSSSHNDLRLEELHEIERDIHKHNMMLESLQADLKEHEIKAQLHNIPIHLDRDLEDSIVISRVHVVPLQASYGRSQTKNAKVFCPPMVNQQLKQDQTVKLRPSLLGECPG